MTCSRRLYKGNDYEICLPLTDTGVTLVRFYTGKDVYVEKEPEISGDSMCFSLMKEDLEPLTDGVIRYEVVTEYETTDTNSPYVLKTPENYDAKSLDEIIEEAYQSGYTDGYESGYTDGYESGYTDGQDECHKPSKNYFTIEILEDGVFYVRRTTRYSINDGEWTEIINNAELHVNAGDKIRFRGNEIYQHDVLFSGNTIQFNVSGNIMSLHYGSDFEEGTTCFGCSGLFYGSTGLIDASNLVLPATALTQNCYNGMFRGCTSLTNAPELPATALASGCCNYMFSGCTSLTSAPAILPATSLADNCYYGMFQGCTSLTQAPELPATTLADNCYNSMFNGCTSLTSTPALPATTLSYSCYSNMFNGCTSLIIAPELPATTLAEACYNGMFKGCTSLTQSPELPATTLASGCYYGMFDGCTGLTTSSSILPATTLVGSCYRGMFRGCTSLNYIKCLATNISATNCTINWVNGVAASGTFVKAAGVTWPTGASGIPSGWTVISQ